MAAIFPKILPTGYAGDYTDFLRTKKDTSGALRIITGMVNVTSGTTIGTIIGLAPFNKGAKLVTGGSQIYTPQLDTGTGLTMSVGYYYTDSSSAGANAASNTSAYSSSDSHSQLAAGGLLVLGNTTAGSSLAGTNTAQTVDLQGDGWFVVQTGTGSTATNQASAAMSFSLAVAYDVSGITN